MLKVHEVLRGHYVIESLIEQTGMRAVYRATDKWKNSNSGNNDHEVMLTEYLVPYEDATLFERQLSLLKTLRHASLPLFRDSFRDDNTGKHYLVTSWVEGRPLSAWMTKGMATSDAVSAIRQIADALTVLHKANITHRDIRPQNIYLQGTGKATLVNFGLMRLVQDEQPAKVNAKFIKGWGSPNYAAPEQFETSSVFGPDGRSDVYSLGATLYHALTNTQPLTAAERLDGEALALPSQMVQGIPKYLERAIGKAMQLHPDERYANAEAFRQALIAPNQMSTPGRVSAPLRTNADQPDINGFDTRPTSIKPSVEPEETEVPLQASPVHTWIPALGAALAVTALVVLGYIAVQLLSGNNLLSFLPVQPGVRTVAPVGTADVNATGVAAQPNAITEPAAETIVIPTAAPLDIAPTSVPVADSSSPAAAPAATRPPWKEEQNSIGNSVQGRPISVYKFGNGPVVRILIGAIHGGYEWNTTTLLSRTLSYYRKNPKQIPNEVTLYILPIANPDGYARSKDLSGRNNANNVDLNRNWDYNWNITATHGTRVVSAGTAAFSEPETQALRNFLLEVMQNRDTDAAIFYHSAFAATFQGTNGSGSRTTELAKLYAGWAGYRFRADGVPGQLTTGDAIDWMTAKAGLTGIEVELRTHDGIDERENLLAIQNFLKWNVPTPAQTQSANTSKCASPYTVQKNETVGDILIKCGLTFGDLPRVQQLNPQIKDINVVGEGATLNLP